MEYAEAEKLLTDCLATLGRTPRTQETYALMLRLFARRVQKPLDAVAPQDIDDYQRYLVTERKVGFSSFNQATCALRFFYRECLEKRDWPIPRMPYQRKRRVLPEILSPEEVAGIFAACSNLKHKAVLMTSYSGGLRLRETLGLLPSDVDSQRMMIRVEQGKGRKDRYVMLSPVLLVTLREYGKAFRPARWLFEGKIKGAPLSASTAEKVFKVAARTAGIAKKALLLPTLYFQIVFTIPGELHPFFRTSPEVCLDLLFEAVSETLTEVARRRLKAEIGFTTALHTWTQQLDFHPHIHCVVPAGGLALDHSQWIAARKTFFLPVKVLRKVFRGKLLSKIERALRGGQLASSITDGLALLQRASKKTWIVYAKPPLAGPQHVVRYLSRYVHRIAISNSRILAYDGTDVTFRYMDRADGNNVKTRVLSGPVFARRFLQHVLPPRFVRIRHYGLLAARRRKDLAHCRELLRAAPVPHQEKDPSWVAAFERLFGRNPLLCPKCKVGGLEVREVLHP